MVPDGWARRPQQKRGDCLVSFGSEMRSDAIPFAVAAAANLREVVHC